MTASKTGKPTFAIFQTTAAAVLLCAVFSESLTGEETNLLLRGANIALDAHGNLVEEQDPVQGLYTFVERMGVKPYPLFEKDDGMQTFRTIYHDRKFGTPVWIMDDSPTVEQAASASMHPFWNADASVLCLIGRRTMGGELVEGWFLDSDFKRLTPSPNTSRPNWDREDPDRLYIHDDGRLDFHDMRTGELKTLVRWQPFPRERIYGTTADGRYFFLDTPNGGLWVPYTPGDEPIPEDGLNPGRPGGPPWPEGVPTRFGSTAPYGNARRNPVTEIEEWGHLIRIRTGVLIDRKTGEMREVIAPASGNNRYLQAYLEGRIEFPEGGEWENVEVLTADSVDELFDLFSYFPTSSHGHESPSPDGLFMARDGATTTIVRVREDGRLPSIKLCPEGRNYHVHWFKHPRFFVGWVRGWHFFDQPQRHCPNGNIVFQIFTDGTAQPVYDTKHRLNGYYAGGEFSMQSPDSTKLHSQTSMTGRFRTTVAVMARPRPPINPTWSEIELEEDRRAVKLAWEPSQYSRETSHYLVYRATRSGDDYELLTPEGVEGLEWVDETVEPGTAHYYVITSVEHSGLESGYSREMARAGIDIAAGLNAPLVVYVEAEDAIKDIGTEERPGLAMGADRLDASDWYYVYRHPREDAGAAELPVFIPADAEYFLWARIRNNEGGEGNWRLQMNGNAVAAGTASKEWTWVRAGDKPVALREGMSELRVETGDAGAALDLICLATDPQFTPSGPRPETVPEPPAPARARAENIQPRVNRLTWEPAKTPFFSHYNVYASREPIKEVSQELLRGSPNEEELMDWGLRADTEYYYAVTTVDRRGNESEPVFASATTPPREHPRHDVELAFVEGELEGPFEKTEADGLRAARYVVPENPSANRVSWTVDVPHEDEYFLWLRHLHRGKGRRGGEANQRVSVLLDGREVMRLGGGFGGLTDLQVPEKFIQGGGPLAERLWTWVWPGRGENLEGIRIPAGRHRITLENLNDEIRYDVLYLTNEPTFLPPDGRLRQRW